MGETETEKRALKIKASSNRVPSGDVRINREEAEEEMWRLTGTERRGDNLLSEVEREFVHFL